MRRFPVLVTLFFVILTFSSCLLLGDGSNTLIKETSNKKHTKKAILFLREAGATVSNSYQVIIADYQTQFDTSAIGNVFTVDDNNGNTQLTPTSISFNWIADNKIEITYDKRLRTFLQRKSVDGIMIIYKTK